LLPRIIIVCIYLECSRNVVDEVLLLGIIHYDSEELPGLSEVTIGVCWLISPDESTHLVLRCERLWSSNIGLECVGLIVGVGATVAIDSHGTISLAIRNSSSIGTIDGDLYIYIYIYIFTYS
jgi:hypothetical protein